MASCPYLIFLPNSFNVFINPQIDCVFKAILGADENKPALLSFLNGIIKPQFPITDVIIINPYNEKEFIGDKLSIVDIKAKDETGRLFQIEIQMATHAHLTTRMLYTWSDIYASQLQSGGQFDELNPVISIWLLTENVFGSKGAYHHAFQIADIKEKKILNDHCAIHVIELEKWQKSADQHTKEPLPTEDQWIYFFKEAKNWTELPDELTTPELKLAMTTLQRFSEKEKAYHLYQARQNFIREERTKQAALEKALKERADAIRMKEKERRAKEEERRAKEEERQEKERLLALLKKSGIDPHQN
jgi:predicted transposase/invertase (TIGR01784 family)